MDLAKIIQRDGYVHLTEKIDTETFQRMACQLGYFVSRSTVKIQATKQLFHQPVAIPFHTDSIYIDYVGWRCIEPDHVGGESLLLDLIDIGKYFDAEELQQLGEVLSGPVVFPTAVTCLWPLVEMHEGRYRIFYTPWNVKLMNSKIQSIYKRFEDYLNQKAKNDVISVQLEAGEALFVDNRRILHGRQAINPLSKRHLERIFVSRDAKNVKNFFRSSNRKATVAPQES